MPALARTRHTAPDVGPDPAAPAAARLARRLGLVACGHTLHLT